MKADKREQWSLPQDNLKRAAPTHPPGVRGRTAGPHAYRPLVFPSRPSPAVPLKVVCNRDLHPFLALFNLRELCGAKPY